MGVANLSSHASGKKHSDIHMQRSCNTGTTFFGNSSTGEVQETNKKGNLVRKENVSTNALQAEVLWTLKVISSHYSLRSCLGLKELFEVMFSDSEIAKSFKLSKTKCGYFINFGLAPYCKDLLVREIKAANIFVVSFDEFEHSFARGTDGCTS